MTNNRTANTAGWVCHDCGPKSNYICDRIQFTWIGFANNARLAELEACYRTRKEFKTFLKNNCRNMMQLNKCKCQLQHLSRKITIAQLQDWEQMNKHQVYRKGVGDQSKSQTEHASTMSHRCEESCSTERCINRTVISRT